MLILDGIIFLGVNSLIVIFCRVKKHVLTVFLFGKTHVSYIFHIKKTPCLTH
jgi:hypothetical protein